MNSAEDMQMVADEASVYYCPCGGQCHHSPNPCSFGCIAGANRQGLDGGIRKLVANRQMHDSTRVNVTLGEIRAALANSKDDGR